MGEHRAKNDPRPALRAGSVGELGEGDSLTPPKSTSTPVNESRMNPKRGKFVRRAELQKARDKEIRIMEQVNKIKEAIENIGSGEEANGEGASSEPDMLEFESKTSSLVKSIEDLMKELEGNIEECSWGEGSDPNLEQSLLESVRGEIFNNSFQLEQSMKGWKLETFDRVGGPNTLRNLWAKQKSLEQVCGLKRNSLRL